MMSQPIRISEKWMGNRAVVRLSGRILSGSTAGRLLSRVRAACKRGMRELTIDLLSRVRAACKRGMRELTIDLAGLTAIDCGGIGALLVCLQDAERSGATLRVTRGSAPVRSMLAQSSLLDVFERGGLPGKHTRRGAGQDTPLLVAG